MPAPFATSVPLLIRGFFMSGVNFCCSKLAVRSAIAPDLASTDFMRSQSAASRPGGGATGSVVGDAAAKVGARNDQASDAKYRPARRHRSLISLHPVAA